MRSWRILMLALVVAGCQAPVGESALAIVDGTLAEEGEVRSTVSIFDVEYDTSGCTGVLVSPRVVLTAAHCVTDLSDTGAPPRLRSADELRVVVGAVRPEEASDEQVHAISSMHFHEDFLTDFELIYEPDHHHDIAVILLETAIEGVPVAPVLPEERLDELREGTSLLIAGYGYITPQQTDSGAVLYAGTTPYLRSSEFEFLAGGGENADGCYGDSGGPAYLVEGDRWWTVGTFARVVSEESICGDGSIYTLAPKYTEWVETVTEGEYSSTESEATEAMSGGCWVGRASFSHHVPCVVVLCALAGRFVRRRRGA